MSIFCDNNDIVPEQSSQKQNVSRCLGVVRKHKKSRTILCVLIALMPRPFTYAAFAFILRFVSSSVYWFEYNLSENSSFLHCAVL